MAKTKLYEVELQASQESGAKKTMWRAGREFEVKVAQVLELTKEEVEVFENDKRFKLSETDGTSRQEDESESSSDSEEDSSTSTDESSEEDDSSEDSDSEDSSSDEAEENSDDSTEDESSDEDEQVTEDELTVDGLVRDNSRAELNALALESGIENPEALSGKPEVAQAIVDAKARQADESTEDESEATS